MLSTNVTHGGNFIFTIAGNDLKSAEFYISEFTGLGMSFVEVQPQAYMGQLVKRPGDVLTFEDATLTILLDEEYTSLQEIYDFMAVTTKNIETNALEWNSNFTGLLYAASNRNNFQKKIEFKNCWFKSMQDVVFSTTLTEDTPVPLVVTLVYDSYKMIDA